MSSPRLAYLLTAFPTISETFVEGEFRALMARGLPVDLYATRNFRESADPGEGRDDRGLEVIRSPYLWGSGVLLATLHFLLNRPLRTLKTLVTVIWGNLPSPRYLLHALALFPKSLVFAHRMERRGTVHIHATWGHYPATVAFVIARILGIPFSFSAHASLDVSRDTTFQPRKVREAQFVLTCNEGYRRFLVDRYPDCSEKILLIHHGVSLQQMPGSADIPKREPPEIISVGRLTPEKGFLDLLEACRQLQQRGVRFRLRIFGQGPLRSRIEEKIRSGELEGQVILEGVAPHSSLLQAYVAARVVALASYRGPSGELDGIPNVLVEALACGTPVVTTRHPGSEELLGDGRFGQMVLQRDPAGLARALEAALQEPDRFQEQAQRGRASVRERFDRERNVEAIATLFRKQLETARH